MRQKGDVSLGMSESNPLFYNSVLRAYYVSGTDVPVEVWCLPQAADMEEKGWQTVRQKLTTQAKQ